MIFISYVCLQVEIVGISEKWKMKNGKNFQSVNLRIVMDIKRFPQNHIHFLKDPILNEQFPRFPFSNRVHFLPDLASFHWNMSVSSFEVNAAAAMRDYYVEPRLGMELFVDG